MAAPPHPPPTLASTPGLRAPLCSPSRPREGPGPGAPAGSSGWAGGARGVLAGATEAQEAMTGGLSSALVRVGGSMALWVRGLWQWAGQGFFVLPWRLFGWARDAGRCGFGFIVHLQGDGGVKAAPSGAVLVDLESGIGRGTGLATGGGGGSKNDPGTLPWPLPLGCEQHK